MDDIKFQAVQRLVGKTNFNKIKETSFCVIGLGGVGSWAAEALVRSGVEQLHLVDYDEVCLSNTNRQLQATQDNIGQSKALSLKKRFLNINPEINIKITQDFFSDKNAKDILDSSDIILDAIDSLGAKCLLASISRKQNKSLIVCGAAGGKSDPTKIQISDLSKTINDPLLQKMRKKLRRDYQFPRGKRKFGIQAVYSLELPFLDESCKKPEGGLDCNTGYGNAVYFTAPLGFAGAYQALAQAQKLEPKSCLTK